MQEWLNWQKIFSLSEISGPYVQYATLRLRAILNKTTLNHFQPYQEYDWQAEHPIMLKILNVEDVLEDACQKLELNRIANHIAELTRMINRYYDNNQVLDAKLIIQSSRLWFIDIVHRHLVFALGILGIKLPDRM